MPRQIAALFQQANEMVAAERKENALLRERLQHLEQQNQTDAVHSAQQENFKLRDRIRALEQRDADRKRRLERLEVANKRIEKAKAMLMPP